MNNLKENLDNVCARVAAACAKAARRPGEIRILAASKKHPAERIRGLYSLGQRAFGENYVQEALAKVEVDPRTGAIARLVRKDGSEANLAGEGGLDDYLYVLGRGPREARTSGAALVTVVDAGPLVARLRVDSDAPGAKHLTREIRVCDGSDSVEVTNTLDKTKVREKEGGHLAFPFRVPGATLRFDLGEALVVPEASQLAGACKDYLAAHAVDVSGHTSGVTLTTLDAPLFESGALTDETRGAKDVRAFRETVSPGTAVYSYG